jgi:hypothetical protein
MGGLTTARGVDGIPGLPSNRYDAGDGTSRGPLTFSCRTAKNRSISRGVVLNDYPMLHFLLRWGKPGAAVLATAVIVAGIWAAAASGDWLWLLVGLVIAAIGYALALSYVELVRLIVDMLLPKP